MNMYFPKGKKLSISEIKLNEKSKNISGDQYVCWVIGVPGNGRFVRAWEAGIASATVPKERT